MRKLIVSINVTLNGFMAGPNGELDWHMPYWDEEMSRVSSEQLGNADTILLGRVTYTAMARYWPAQQAGPYAARGDVDFADMMNSYTKVVFSQTLTNVSNWSNSQLANRSIALEVNQLKQQPGKDIMVYGSGSLVTALIRKDLVDEYHIWLYPVLIEQGRPLFENLRDRLSLKPFQAKAFGNGVVLMQYGAVKTG
ncbi:dihydrofolate reductase family protein [Mucilaginibacter sp.]|jgi:dihydrofolate reductase|uniref:dihydrofolate reductase family protein n=1 Tax=Mucilaginibacter sp. TaxID=1882438 RepID=UPI003568684E